MILYSRIEGQGQPFIILHGFLGMSDNWKTLATQFASSGFEVHALDLRNHGKSFHSNVFNYDVMVEDIKNYCESKQLNQFTLLGHSMGGKVAMQFACLYPDMVNKLLVADIGPKYYAPHHQTILRGLNAVDFKLYPSRKDVDEIVFKYIPDFGTRQFLLKSLYWKTPQQLDFRFNLLELTLNIEEVGKALPSNLKFEKKTLFLRGSNSNYILDDDILAIKAQFPNAELITIKNAGHWLHVENPSDFFENVMNFIICK